MVALPGRRRQSNYSANLWNITGTPCQIKWKNGDRYEKNNYYNGSFFIAYSCWLRTESRSEV